MTESDIREKVILLVEGKTGAKRDKVMACTDIERDLGCTGDDFFELFDAFAKTFNVDMSGYLWYFHTHDESMATINPYVGNAPSKQVARIPIDLDTLTRMAILGKWSLEDPRIIWNGTIPWVSVWSSTS